MSWAWQLEFPMSDEGALKWKRTFSRFAQILTVWLWPCTWTASFLLWKTTDHSLHCSKKKRVLLYIVKLNMIDFVKDILFFYEKPLIILYIALKRREFCCTLLSWTWLILLKIYYFLMNRKNIYELMGKNVYCIAVEKVIIIWYQMHIHKNV